jgi:hypothetical protein
LLGVVGMGDRPGAAADGQQERALDAQLAGLPARTREAGEHAAGQHDLAPGDQGGERCADLVDVHTGTVIPDARRSHEFPLARPPRGMLT